MTATLTFTMPDDRDAHTLAVHALDLYCVMCDVSEELRRLLKYGHEYKTADEALEWVREHLSDTMRDHGVSVDMVG